MNPPRFASLLLTAMIAATAMYPAAALAQHREHRRYERARTHEEVVPSSAYTGHPRLVVLLVLDNFSGNDLQRWRSDFKGQGFNLLLDHGAYFPDCYYDYANNEAAPGHAAIATGAYTNGNGISANTWWDLSRNRNRPISSVEDEHYQLVGLPGAGLPAGGDPPQDATGASPGNLLASTIGDELRLATQGEAKVFGVAMKDRAAILSTGRTANGAFWIDPASGYFVTSTYYMQQLPTWAASFNTSGAIALAEQTASAPDATNFLKQVGGSPAANEYELQFAEALIQGEQLGQRNVTDLLTISLSANGSTVDARGPGSTGEEQMVDALDTQLAGFFTWLGKDVPGGLGNVWIALTADHGVAPAPETAARYGMNAARIDLPKLIANLNYAMNMKFSPGEKIEYILPQQRLPYISLNEAQFIKDGINEPEAETAVQQALPKAFRELTSTAAAAAPPSGSQSGSTGAPAVGPSETRLPPRPLLFRSYTRAQLAAGNVPPTPWGRLIANSYSPNGGWYLMMIPGAYQMSASGGATHFGPWSYDRHVPLALWGAPFAAGVYLQRVQPVDLAPTFAALLGVNMPSAAVGKVLTEALKPASSVKYPRIEKPRIEKPRIPGKAPIDRAVHRILHPAAHTAAHPAAQQQHTTATAAKATHT
jgi:arylsulfatase A-like enzyme